MEVSEIFFSIQGEGSHVGIPTLFIRLYGCNLHCWFCDTKYTWMDTQSKVYHVLDDIKRLNITEHVDLKLYDKEVESHTFTIPELIKKATSKGIRHVTITGGEPMLQLNTDEGIQFIKELRNFGLRIDIETNGTFVPRNELQEYGVIDQWNVSPKLIR